MHNVLFHFFDSALATHGFDFESSFSSQSISGHHSVLRFDANLPDGRDAILRVWSVVCVAAGPLERHDEQALHCHHLYWCDGAVIKRTTRATLLRTPSETVSMVSKLGSSAHTTEDWSGRFRKHKRATTSASMSQWYSLERVCTPFPRSL